MKLMTETARYFRNCSAAAIVSILTVFTIPVAMAQPENVSHRRLQLPDGGSSDIQRQMLLLQHLRALASGQKKTPTEDSKSPPNLSPRDLQQFQQIMKSLGGNISPNQLPRPEDLPPGLVDSFMKNPNAQRQMRDMLREFKRSGQLPRGSNGSGPGIPPPKGSQSYPTPGVPSSQNPSDAQEPVEPNTREYNNIDDLTKMAQDFLREYQDKFSGQNDPNSTPPNGSGRKTNNGTNQLPNTNQEWIDYLDNLVKQQHGTNQGSDPDRNPRQSGNRMPNRSPSDARNSTHDGSSTERGGSGLPIVQELLKQMKDVPLDALPNLSESNTNGGTDRRVSANGSPHGNGGGNRNGSGLETDLNSADPSPEMQQKIEETKAQLKSGGLQQTLKKIYRNARSETKSKQNAAAASGDLDSGGGQQIEGALLRTMDGIRKDVVELVKEGQLKFKAPKNRSQSSTGSRNTRSRSQTPSSSSMTQLRKSAKNFFNGLTSGPNSPPRPATPPAWSNGGSSAAEIPWSGPAFLAVLIGIIIAGFVIARELNAARDDDPNGAAARQILSSQIRTRADVVQAFHALALKPEHNARDWWTHRQVVTDIAEAAPNRKESAHTLAELYEQARYLPDEENLTEAQIREAQAAFRKCEQ